MKTFLTLLLFFVIASCTVTQTADVPCWRDRLCTGDTYVYKRAPRDGGGYYTTNIQIIQVRANYVLIRHANGREHWVRPAHVEKYSTPIKVKKVHSDNPGRGPGQGQGRGRGNK